MQELEIQKNRVIEDYLFRIERIKEQIDIIKKKNLEAVADLDSRGYLDAEQLQKKYEEKIGF